MRADGIVGECRNCGSVDLRNRFSVNRCDMQTCNDCSYVQVSQVPDDAELADIYRAAYFEKPKYVDDAAARHEFDRRATLLLDHGLRPDWKVLDYGCAGGDFVAGINARCEAWGVDYSSEAIAKAAQRYPDIGRRFSTLDGLERDGSYDAVTLWDVAEHVPSPPETLAIVSAALKPGGIVLLSTPNIGALVAKLMGRRWAFMTPPEHLGFFDRQSVGVALRKAGFAIEHWSSRGKLVNVAFLVHKAGRVFPGLIPKSLGSNLRQSRFGRACVYVPTGDIQYVVARKIEGFHR